MGMRSFGDLIGEFLRESQAGSPRQGGPSFDPRDPLVAASLEWERLSRAFLGRTRKPPSDDGENKQRRRMRRHAEEVAASAWTKVSDSLTAQRAGCIGALDRSDGHLERELGNLAERCADHYFTADPDGPPESTLSQTVDLLHRGLNQLTDEAGRELVRTADIAAKGVAREREFIGLVLFELEGQLAESNKFLVPRVTLDRAALDASIEVGLAEIFAEQDDALQSRQVKIGDRLRRFEQEMTQALRDLHAEHIGAPVSERSSGEAGGAIQLPRPIPFKALAEDYAEEALALYAAPEGGPTPRSRLGGLPDLPDGQNWPSGRAGNRLHFIAQIDLAETPWLPPTMERSGTLLFFALLDEELDCGSVAVLYDEGSSCVAATIPENLAPIAGIRLRGEAARAQADERLLPEQPLGSALIASVPAPQAFDTNAHSKARFADYCRRYPLFRGQQLLDATGREPISDLGHHQMFGYVPSVQEPLPADSKTLTLLQIVSDHAYGMLIGDGGAIDFRIAPEVLAHQQWQDVLAIYAGG